MKGYKYIYLEDYNPDNIKITKGKTSKKEVLQIDILTDEIIKKYDSCASTKIDGFNPTNVGQVCRGEKKSHKNFK